MDGTIRRWNIERGAETNVYVAHISWVRSLAVCSNEEKFYSAGNDLALLTWDWRQARPEALVQPHRQAVTAVRSLPKVLRLATAGYDNMANVWDAKSGRKIHELMGHQGPVTDLAASPDGRLLATVSKEDDTLRIWNVETGEQIQWHQLAQGKGAF